MSVDRQNIRIEPMNVIWGSDVFQVQTITTRADVASSLNNDYFWLYDSAGAKHYFWFDVNNAGADPAPGSGTAHEVDIAVGATAAQVATALELVIEAVTGFNSTVSGAVVTVTHTAAGYAQAAHEGVGTLFTFAVTTEGDLEQDAGCIEGNIEYTPNEEVVDVTCHQHGTTVISGIRSGMSPEVVLSFKETSMAQLRRVFLHPGGAHTPAGASGTEVFGLGSSRQFFQTIDQSKKLRLHPIRLDETDYSQDRTFWLAYPNLDTISHSGEEILMLPVTFKIFPDFTKPAQVNMMCIGDFSQLEA